MRIGRTLPPAASPISWKNIFSGVSAIFKGDSDLDRFSEEIKDYFDKSHCFLVSSGKTALTLILLALKEQHPDRDEVIIPAYTCYSVPSAIVRAGLKIKLCDTTADGFDFDFYQLVPLLNGEKVLCVVPTHLFGLPADIKRLNALIDDPAVTVIEDAAQSMGGEWQGDKLGTLGDVGFFSLGRGKAFSAVEGGVILTDCDKLAVNLKLQIEEIQAYTFIGTFKLFFYAVALNALLHPSLFWIPNNLPFLKLGETIFDPHFAMKIMSSFQAGLTKDWAEKLRHFRQERQVNTGKWLQVLGPVSSKIRILKQAGSLALIRLPVEIEDEQHRAEILENGASNGYGISIAYPNAINEVEKLTEFFKGEKFPAAENHAKRLITVPIHPFVSPRDIEKAVVMISNICVEVSDEMNVVELN